jgi:hypothetical protein
MRSKTLLLLFVLGWTLSVHAQELRARVTVVPTRVSNNVNRNVFTNMQTALNNFLNNRKWTNLTYAPNERIECNFLLNVESTEEINVWAGSLTIQSARPVYNSSYLSPIINFKDDKIAFKYQEFQQLEFNENRVTGNDALSSNLTAVFAYYAYMIIGFDALSFSPNGGEVYFQKAQNIINNAPDGRLISGWKPFDGNRNRYWLAENVLNTRYAAILDVYYNYYRNCLDKMYENENLSRSELLNVINQMEAFNTDNPNTMINQFFFQGKGQEIVKILSKAPQAEKVRAADILSRIDVTNAAKYNELNK